MKKISLLSLLLLVNAVAVLAADEADTASGQGSGKMINMGTVLFIVGIIVFVIVVRKLYDLRNKKGSVSNETKSVQNKDNIYEPRFWYQCKNCKVTIRKDSPPKNADCFKAVDHIWTQLAEVGRTKYLCKSCNTLIEARTVPVSENCPDAPMHNWERLG